MERPGENAVRKVRILVAEDNVMIRQHIVVLLRGEFDVVDAVADGRSLVAAAVATCPDVIVSDISMPRLSGPQAMEELKSREYDIPFVFVSADVPSIAVKGMTFVSKTDMIKEMVPAVYRAFFGYA
jgi:CheY-like chemotaxis protein